MTKTFNAVNTATEILTDLFELKVSNGIKVQVGEKDGALREIEINSGFKGYDAVRKSINRQTEKFFDKDCVIKVGDLIVNFKGGKFSNELLKMLERTTTEFFNGGDYLNEDANFKYNLQVVKLAFLNKNITIIDLLPIAAKFTGLSKMQLALLGEALANHENFKAQIENVQNAIKMIAEQNEAEVLELENQITNG